MDRLLNDISVERSGSLARSFGELSIDNSETSGTISEDAPHWAIESFVPVQIGPLVEYLLARQELTAANESRFRQFCADPHSIQHDQIRSYHRRFAAVYSDIDPDGDCRDPLQSREKVGISKDQPAKLDQDAANQVMAMCAEILDQAGYQKLSPDEIEQCSRTFSQFGVPLHVDFDLFEVIDVYARGDIIGSRFRRRLLNLYRRESVSIPVYQRMVVIFQLANDEWTGENLSSSALHLRMFKNIPKQDISMLLPGTRVRIRGVDRVKFIVPSLGGFLMSLRRVAQYVLFFTFIALSKSVIIVLLIVGYLIKSVFGYFQTKKHYQLNLTRNLYFQKLDCNAGVVYRMIQEAERQSIVEMIFAYYGILISDEPVSERKLRRRCERLVREAIDVEVDFRISAALGRLTESGCIEETKDGWRVIPS